MRLRQQREQEAAFERGFFQPKSIRPPPSNSPAAEPSALRQAIDKALIADFFFVLFAAVWLVVGLGVKVATDSTVRLLLLKTCTSRAGFGAAQCLGAAWAANLLWCDSLREGGGMLKAWPCIAPAGGVGCVVTAVAVGVPASHWSAHAGHGEIPALLCGAWLRACLGLGHAHQPCSLAFAWHADCSRDDGVGEGQLGQRGMSAPPGPVTPPACDAVTSGVHTPQSDTSGPLSTLWGCGLWGRPVPQPSLAKFVSIRIASNQPGLGPREP